MNAAPAKARAERGPVDVGAHADFEEDRVIRVKVRGRAIGIVSSGGRLHAFADRCPHMGAPMCAGRLVGLIEAPGGELDVSRRPVLACPWHGWEFDLVSGRSLASERYRVRTYAVWAEGGRVLVDPARHADSSRTESTPAEGSRTEESER